MFGQAVGQLGPASPFSQSSPGSTTPLPHTGMQLLSLLALHPDAQQPSPLVQVEMVPDATHCRWQPVPWSAYAVQPMLAHMLGQLPSQTSPDSMTLLPQNGRQSLSLSELQVPEPPPGHSRVSSNDVEVDDRGLLYLIDRGRGLHILERV